jgi:hypothetical protein
MRHRSGKSALVSAALADATSAEGAAVRGYRVVRLNGLAHSNDASALRELARQIHVDLPTELDELDDADLDADAAAAAEEISHVSTGEVVHALLAALKEGNRSTSQCLVIILDEFDLFAHSGKQSLL